jgi:hypothetical protein
MDCLVALKIINKSSKDKDKTDKETPKMIKEGNKAPRMMYR